jgi:superfamily II DNA or RNA helicase
MSELRPYQTEAINALRDSIRGGVKRIVLQAPTGAGKTLMASTIGNGAHAKRKRLAFVVPAISLIDQTLEAFAADGLRDVGVIQQRHIMTDWVKPIQICSIQTVANRGFPDADIIMFDECHVLYKAHKNWLADARFADKLFIGLSATPWAKGLGQHFHSLLTVTTTAELIGDGYLSPFKVFATGHPDLKGVKITAGEYQQDQLSEAMQRGSLSADIIETYQKQWGQGQTLCFAVDCAHAKALQERFEYAGIKCGYQDAETPLDVRSSIKRMFHNGTYQVVVNVDTLTMGVDWDVRCLILARPTRSEMRYVQIIGRGLRTAPGKQRLVILDHSDTTQRLGFVTDIMHDELDDGTPKPKAAAVPRDRLPVECKVCGALHPPNKNRICPNCGALNKLQSNILENDGVLIEIDRADMLRTMKKANREWSTLDKAQFLSELQAYGRYHGYKPGWAANKYREKFGVWPNGIERYAKPINSISPKVMAWVRAGQIKYAKKARAL